MNFKVIIKHPMTAGIVLMQVDACATAKTMRRSPNSLFHPTTTKVSAANLAQHTNFAMDHLLTAAWTPPEAQTASIVKYSIMAKIRKCSPIVQV